VIVPGQRLHHSCFVERSDCSRGRVGQEHESLVVDSAQRSFDDRGDVRVAGIELSSELLEAIEDLVVSVVRGNNPHRRFDQLGSMRWKVPRTERGVARADELDREIARGTGDLVFGRDLGRPFPGRRRR
jgi:hypothetical protein